MEYKISHRRITVCNGYRCWRERRYIAMRRISVLGIFSFWFPSECSEWRLTFDEAHKDAKRDAALRAPLDNSLVVKVAAGFEDRK